jgi:hypothetical protein
LDYEAPEKSMRHGFLLLILGLGFDGASAGAAPAEPCLEFSSFPESLNRTFDLRRACASLKPVETCESFEGRQIFAFDKEGNKKGGPRKILVLGQVHGDEVESSHLALIWIERLLNMNPSNTWKIIPRLNPDGFKRRTRMNARGVDINRNFPTKDWDKLAVKEWREKRKSNPRRFPGESAGSEPETKCAISIVDHFKPDLVVALHTPYGVLDFDGPQHRRIEFNPLKWVRLGTFPGSLGRYLWQDRGVPVLTVELKPDSLDKDAQELARMQDAIASLSKDE